MKLIPDQSEAIAQCRANIEAVILFYHLPPVEVVSVLSDRIMARVPADFVNKLEKTKHFRTWGYVSNHGTTAVQGWREDCPLCSMQIVEHSTGIYEFDIDRANPDYGVALALGHLWEVVANHLTRGKTDPFAIRRGLLKRGIAA